MPFAIQRVLDSAFLPSHRHGHFSQVEIGDYGAPRLFATKNGAQVSLHNWSLGHWHCPAEWDATDEYGSGNYVQGTPIPSGKCARKKSDYRVVEVYLTVKES